MNFNKCSRCGNFYVTEGAVCPKCSPKDNFEFSTFKSYVEEHGSDASVNNIAIETGISTKNVSRYIELGNVNTGNENLNGGELNTIDIF